MGGNFTQGLHKEILNSQTLLYACTCRWEVHVFCFSQSNTIFRVLWYFLVIIVWGCCESCLRFLGAHCLCTVHSPASAQTGQIFQEKLCYGEEVSGISFEFEGWWTLKTHLNRWVLNCSQLLHVAQMNSIADGTSTPSKSGKTALDVIANRIYLVTRKAPHLQHCHCISSSAGFSDRVTPASKSMHWYGLSKFKLGFIGASNFSSMVAHKV